MDLNSKGSAPRLKNLHVFGDADRYGHRIGNDFYSQPGALFRLISANQKQQRSAISPRNAGRAGGDPAAADQAFQQSDSAYGQDVAERRDLAPKLQATEWSASYHPPPGSAKPEVEWRGW